MWMERSQVQIVRYTSFELHHEKADKRASWTPLENTDYNLLRQH